MARLYIGFPSVRLSAHAEVFPSSPSFPSFPVSRLFDLARNSGLGAYTGKICRKADTIASCL
ncbi:hypothetical protein [Coleofasciculus chthonoplastes]|uniref:hypothetical protein n=1 Tax=Coleofasciculus chthonoplastes TaxID=64178 RepID=UPI003301DFD1